MPTPIGKMKINILGGSGVMGQVHKPIFEAAGHEVIISGRSSLISLEKAARQSDLTIISVPISVTEETIRGIGPYCEGRALMDFASIKAEPVNMMLKYSPENCEVGGLHPLYGAVSSISGRTVVYCPTERSGERCEILIQSLKLAGAKIKTMTSEEHDYVVNGKLQNARVALLGSFAQLVAETGLSINELYELSPPPTKILLDLIARQYDSSNDALYAAMLSENPRTEEIKKSLIGKMSSLGSSEEIRNLFGEELRAAQERAKRIIEIR